VIGVKKNQLKLYRQIEQITSIPENIMSRHSEWELNKGRLEWREVSVSSCLSGISSGWKGLSQIMKVHRRVKKKGEWHEETAYYISSKLTHAQEYNYGIRSHWEIENSLHWVKDVTFREDASKIRTSHAPQNISTLRNIAINIFRKNDYTNLEQAKRLVSNNIHKLCKMII
jgi:predicted transposase YbfD/YdcC